jgi:hypothetical protein
VDARTWFGALVALGVGLGGAGCGGSIAAICEEMCDCEGCSEDELDECIDEGEDIERLADNEGCEDQFDEFVACTDDEAVCRGDDFEADGCEQELDDLDDCVDDPEVASDDSAETGSG